VVTFNTPPDFENPDDLDSDNQYLITIGVDDGQPENNTATVDIVITIADIDEVPIIESPAEITVDENVTDIIFDFDATDGDAGLPDENLVYSLSDGPDAGSFAIDPSSGELSLIVVPDFEQPSDANVDNQFELEVTVNDGNAVVSAPLTIVIQDLNDEFPVFQSSNAFSVAENSTMIREIIVSDADASNTIELSISGGEDGGLFQLQDGVLSFGSAPDYELPQDADANNEYLVRIRAFDGLNETLQSVTITVDNLNDNFPEFTNESTISLSENTAEVVTLIATDADEADVLDYSIAGGTDASQFSLEGDRLSFIVSPDFEQPADADGDNVYLVDVSVSDGRNFTTQSIEVTVTDANDNFPVFENAANLTVPENTSLAVAFTLTDADFDSDISLSVSGGSDAARFSLQGGQLSFATLPDFEEPADINADNVYEVTIVATDGVNQVTQSLQITVTDTNDNAPVLTIPTSIQLAENSQEVLMLTAEDADAGTAFSYSFEGGQDDGQFAIVGNAVRFVNRPDREQPTDSDGDNVYELTVLVSDGLNSTSQSITVTITDLNDTPPILSTQQAVSINENQTRVSSIAASDEDLVGTLSLSIGGGSDQSQFYVEGSDLYFFTAPDYENPVDANLDNRYEVEVSLTDGVFTTSRLVQVQVANINDNIPEFSLTSKIATQENSSLVTAVSGTDADEGTDLQFIIYGGVDAVNFEISDNQLQFVAPPDFEQPTDVNADNRYDVEVAAFDGKFYRTQVVEVIVDNLNDNPPAFNLPGRIELSENESYVANIAAEDADGSSLNYRLAESPDRSRFSLVASDLRFRQAPNFERPADANADNSYELMLVVSDGEFEDRLALRITISDVEEIAGDINGNGKIDTGEIAGDINNDGSIGDGEIAGDVNGNGRIDSGEIAGDLNGNGIIDNGEKSGDVNGNGRIDENEQEGDTDGDGQVDTKEGTEVVLSTMADEAQVKLYPNPARDYFHLSAIHWPGILEIRDSSGKLMKSVTYQKGMEVSVEGLAPGLYLVHFQSDKQNVLLKLFKQ
jgi:VCBS repeat-containing protein